MRLTKFLLVIIFLSISCAFMSPVNASDEIIYLPVIETLDLSLDGSNISQTVGISSDIDYILGIMFILVWEENSVDYDHFGNHTSALTNGTLIKYNGSQIFESIVSIRSFTTISSEMQILEDDKNPIENYLSAPVAFNDFMGYGLDVRAYDLQFIIQDNIPVYCNSFIVQIHGEKGVYSPDNTAPPPNLLADIQDFAVEFMKEPLWWVAILIPAAAVWMFIRK